MIPIVVVVKVYAFSDPPLGELTDVVAVGVLVLCVNRLQPEGAADIREVYSGKPSDAVLETFGLNSQCLSLFFIMYHVYFCLSIGLFSLPPTRR